MNSFRFSQKPYLGFINGTEKTHLYGQCDRLKQWDFFHFSLVLFLNVISTDRNLC